MLNFIATVQGPALRRSGTRYVADVQDSTRQSRLIPFVFSTDQAYVLEFGHQKIRIMRNEGIVLAPDISILDTNVDPDLDEWKVKTGHGYVDQQGPFRLTTTTTLPAGLSLATNYYITLPHSTTFANGDVALGTERITIADHGYRSSTNRQGPFRLTTNMSLPSGTALQWNTEIDYFIKRIDANTIELYDLITAGTLQTVSAIGGPTFADSNVDTALDTINIDDHGFTDQFGPIELTNSGGGLPEDLAVLTPYFIVLHDKDNFSLSLTAGGSTVGIGTTASGGTHTISGTHTLTATPLYLRQSFALSTEATGITSIVTQTDAGNGTHTITNFDSDSSGDGDLFLEIDTTYQESELADIHFGQSADILYITHPNHPVRKLSRFSNTVWTLDDVAFLDGPYLGIGQGEITDGTTLDASDLAGNRITLTASAAMFRPSDIGRPFRILHGTTWGWGVITGFQTNVLVDVAILSAFSAHDAVTDWRLGAWGESSSLGYPRNVSFFEQRLSFSANPGGPQTFYGSVTADFENMAPTDLDTTIGITDDSSVSYTINSNTVNPIRWMTPIRSLLMGTAAGMWPVQATGFLDPITPTNVLIKRSSKFGTANVTPATMEDLVIYASASKKQVFALGYDNDSDAYISANLTDFADHILLSPVTEMTYAQEPHSIIWAARTDGVLAGCTLVSNQQVLGWHRHVIGGSFRAGSAVVESITVIPTQTEDHDQLWMTVKRTVNGSTVRYIEFMEETFEDGDLLDSAFFVDSGLTRDVPKTITLATAADPVVLTTSLAHGFSNGDEVKIVDVVGMVELNNNSYFITNAATTMSLLLVNGKQTFVDGNVNVAFNEITIAGHGFSDGDRVMLFNVGGTLPGTGIDALTETDVWIVVFVDTDTIQLQNEFGTFEISDATGGGTHSIALTLDGSSFTAYASGGEVRNKTTAISGLTHLVGETVQVSGDGAPQIDKTVDSAGAITIDTASAIVHVGLGYNSDLKTLRIDIPDQAGTTQGMTKAIDKVLVRVDNTVGGKIGPTSSSLVVLLFGYSVMDSPPDLFTGDNTVTFDGGYDIDAQIFIRQDQPLPMTLVALAPTVSIGDG